MMLADVFISHSSKDSSVAKELCDQIEERGLLCWIAPRNVRPGRHFAEEILDAIEGTNATIVILSEDANKSSHVRNEIERAVSKSKPILPIRIRNIAPSRSLELYLSSSQWIDAWSPPILQKIDEIVASLKSLFPDSLKEFDFEIPAKCKSIVGAIAIGGGAIRALESLTKTHSETIQLIASHTYRTTLENCSFPYKIQLGHKLLNGNSAGGNPQNGLEAAKEEEEKIFNFISQLKLLFVVTCLGGGTGSGAAPFICSMAKKLGILTVAVVTTPYHFEGTRKNHLAEVGLVELYKYSDSIISFSNQHLIKKGIQNKNVFTDSDSILSGIVQDISDLIGKPGYLNVDFADVKNIFQEGGPAKFGIGYGKGANAAEQAAMAALNSPLLGDTKLQSIEKALTIHRTGPNAFIESFSKAQEVIIAATPNNPYVISGFLQDDTLSNNEYNLSIILIEGS